MAQTNEKEKEQWELITRERICILSIIEGMMRILCKVRFFYCDRSLGSVTEGREVKSIVCVYVCVSGTLVQTHRICIWDNRGAFNQ